jgi:hypothetical protein
MERLLTSVLHFPVSLFGHQQLTCVLQSSPHAKRPYLIQHIHTPKTAFQQGALLSAFSCRNFLAMLTSQKCGSACSLSGQSGIKTVAVTSSTFLNCISLYSDCSLSQTVSCNWTTFNLLFLAKKKKNIWKQIKNSRQKHNFYNSKFINDMFRPSRGHLQADIWILLRSKHVADWFIIRKLCFWWLLFCFYLSFC